LFESENQVSKPDRDVRSKLRDDANEDYLLLKTALKEGLDADKPVTRRCEFCGKSNSFLIPDHGSRMKAVDLWISQGFGRPAQEKDEQEPDLDKLDVGTLKPEERAKLKRWLIGTMSPEKLAEFRAHWQAADGRVAARSSAHAAAVPREGSRR
jgi:hypothetical protein